MKVVVLCGGLGTRLREETEFRPKPLVEIGGRPILWHLMKIYAYAGFDDFVLCLGYKGEQIKDYFLNYQLRVQDFVLRLSAGRSSARVLGPTNQVEDWSLTFAETGAETMTGGRVARVLPYLRDGGTFMVTYGDGLGDVDLQALLRFHRAHGKLATVTAVRPPSRFGELNVDGSTGRVTEFAEKPQAVPGLINGGFFVFEPPVLNYLNGGDAVVLEREPLAQLARDGQLMAYRHAGFWQPMDTYREVLILNEMWREGRAPWKVWE